jgi:hypothetical protein
MNPEYIESSCGLINGVKFEELTIIEFDSSNFPSQYKVVSSFGCYNPGLDTVQTFWPDRLYFNKPNGHYLWRIDSTANGTYQVVGLYRKRTDVEEEDPKIIEITDSMQKQKFIDSISNMPKRTDVNSSPICPTKFKGDTWYFVNFNDQQYVAYLYVDKKMAYNLHKINLPTNF